MNRDIEKLEAACPALVDFKDGVCAALKATREQSEAAEAEVKALEAVGTPMANALARIVQLSSCIGGGYQTVVEQLDLILKAANEGLGLVEHSSAGSAEQLSTRNED